MNLIPRTRTSFVLEAFSSSRFLSALCGFMVLGVCALGLQDRLSESVSDEVLRRALVEANHWKTVLNNVQSIEIEHSGPTLSSDSFRTIFREIQLSVHEALDVIDRQVAVTVSNADIMPLVEATQHPGSDGGNLVEITRVDVEIELLLDGVVFGVLEDLQSISGYWPVEIRVCELALDEAVSPHVTFSGRLRCQLDIYHTRVPMKSRYSDKMRAVSQSPIDTTVLPTERLIKKGSSTTVEVLEKSPTTAQGRFGLTGLIGSGRDTQIFINGLPVTAHSDIHSAVIAKDATTVILNFQDGNTTILRVDKNHEN